MDDRERFKRAVLWILVGFILLLYLLGALSLWARGRFLHDAPVLPFVGEGLRRGIQTLANLF